MIVGFEVIQSASITIEQFKGTQDRYKKLFTFIVEKMSVLFVQLQKSEEENSPNSLFADILSL